jgi:Mn-dependent DtxR family transcriptional regulator
MKKLEKLGFGKYIYQKGLIINKKAIKLVENDIKRHHILENFFQESLDMTHEQACIESSTIDSFISENLLKNINEKIGPLHQGICGCNLKSPLKPEELRNCHWIKKTIIEG